MWENKVADDDNSPPDNIQGLSATLPSSQAHRHKPDGLSSCRTSQLAAPLKGATSSDPHQAHSKHLLPGNTGPGSHSPQTSGLLGYEHPHGSAYWDHSVKSPHSSTAPCLCGVLPALRQPPALLSWPLPLSPPPDTPIWELRACQGLPGHLSPPLLPSGA